MEYEEDSYQFEIVVQTAWKAKKERIENAFAASETVLERAVTACAVAAGDSLRSFDPGGSGLLGNVLQDWGSVCIHLCSRELARRE